MQATFVLRAVHQFQATPKGQRWDFLSQLTGDVGKSTRLMVFRSVQMSDVLKSAHADAPNSRERAFAAEAQARAHVAALAQVAAMSHLLRLRRRWMGFDPVYSAARAPAIKAATLQSTLAFLSNSRALILHRSEVVIDTAERDLNVYVDAMMRRALLKRRNAAMATRASGRLQIDPATATALARVADKLDFGNSAPVKRRVRAAIRQTNGKRFQLMHAVLALPEIIQRDHTVAIWEEAVRDRANATLSPDIVYIKGATNTAHTQHIIDWRKQC